MTNEELTKYIKHYIKEDKTKSAIMLSGDWGTGKSHYIQNELVDALKKDSNIQCVIVSLYGMKTTLEISKSIYLDIRLKNKQLASQNSKAARFFRKAKKKIEEHKEIATGGAILAKTVVKGVTSFFSVDLSLSEDDMQKLYESMDLSGKLIIFEDLERSRINILDVLGYVNSLVEQDGVKVMLVANEEEIIKKIPEPTKTKQEEEKLDGYHSLGLDNRPYTNKTKEYLKTREKTVSDILLFEGDYSVAIKNIINLFNDDNLASFTSDEHIKRLMGLLSKKNLRSFLFACQKTVDIYKVMPSNLDAEYIETIFYGIVYFSLQWKSGKLENKWDGDSNLSLTLGGNVPLFKCCFDYLTQQRICVEDIEKNAVAYSDLKLYDRNFFRHTQDSDLIIIDNFYLYPEKTVREAIDHIEKKLSDPEEISFYAYDKLAKRMIQISKILNIEITKCKDLMINNLRGRGNKLSGYYLFMPYIDEKQTAETKEFEEFKKKAVEAMRETDTPFLNFDYTPKSAKALYDETIKSEHGFNKETPYAQRFDMDKLSNLLLECSPEQIEYIRGAFITVYRPSNISEYLLEDRDSIAQLHDNLEKIHCDERLDEIQKLQITWFIGNLAEILRKLS